MKYSEAMLKGFKKMRGRQCTYGGYVDDPFNPKSVCVLGAANLVLTGRPVYAPEEFDFCNAFEEAWGAYPQVLNDQGMHWTEIYGMAVAAGL